MLRANHASSVFKTDGPFRRCKMGNNELDVCVNWDAHVMNISVVSEACLQVETSQPGVSYDIGNLINHASDFSGNRRIISMFSVR